MKRAWIASTIIFLFSCSWCYSQTFFTSTTDDNHYPPFCETAANNLALFSQFRNQPVYEAVVENVSFAQGQQYLSYINDRWPNSLNHVDDFRNSDSIGNPKTYFYPETGMISPTTLRYIKIALELRGLFGSLEDYSIIEIGGGYGGQCKIIADLFRFKKYVIVDLPGPLLLAKRFLAEQNVQNVSFASPDDLIEDQNFDLVISNYAFSECTYVMQKKYIKDILAKSERGYLTCNVIPLDSSRKWVYAKKEEILHQLSNSQISWKEFPEFPQTHPTNYLLIWGSPTTE